MRPTILAIESSCDETSAAVVSNGKVLNNIIASQNVHQKYGGVVPELASRAHQVKIVPVVNQALRESNTLPAQLDAIAFTRGPGLMGSLLVGVSFAKGMAVALGKPLIEVNHLQAHVLAHFIPQNGNDLQQVSRFPGFPFLCLTVSGGHTQIVLVKDFHDMEMIGETKDDAVGEAFDKAAKMLGIPYPGGPEVDRLAGEGNPGAYSFPSSSMKGYDFSFSGIKTSLLYFLKKETSRNPKFAEENLKDICASLQKQLVRMLMEKLEKASEDLGIDRIAIAGGVAANSALREAMVRNQTRRGWETFIPEFQYCTDNAAMIGITAHYKYLKGEFCGLDVAPFASLDH